jgi:dTDP-4-dehydrorhamnose reductase
LAGLFHISAIPIDKCSLLEQLAIFYNKDIRIVEYKDIVINRSLNSDKFLISTGHQQPSWHELINNNWL